MGEHLMTDLLPLLGALIVGAFAVARAVRLVTSDNWPPMLWLRLRWLTWTAQNPRRERWSDLLTCPFCFAPYAVLVDLAWAVAVGAHTHQQLDLSTGHTWWWLVNVWAAVSYVAPMIVVRDEPPAVEAEDE